MATIRQLKSGKWNVQIRKSGQKDTSETFILKSDAERWARQTEVEIERGVFQDFKKAEKLTLGDACIKFELEEISKFKSWKSDRSRLDNIRQHQISEITLTNLNTDALTRFVEDRLDYGMSDTSVNHELTLIARIFNTCKKKWGIMIPNGMPYVDRPKKTKGRTRRFSDEEFDAIINETQSKLLGPIMILAVETAMRREEIVKIENKNINLTKKTILILETKNGEDRQVPLSPRAIEIVKMVQSEYGKEGRLFDMTPDAVTQAFKRARARAKSKYNGDNKDFLNDITLHDLRHEATSRIAKKMDDVIELSNITGHKTLEMLKRYYHTDASELAEKLATKPVERPGKLRARRLKKPRD
jgi:integrase